jgi:transposase
VKKYIVRLTPPQRHDLHQLISTGEESARKLLHARILLKADAGEQGPGWTDEQISEALDVSTSTLVRVRRQFAEQGLQAALTRRSLSRSRPRRLDGEQEAHVIALVCSTPPAGRDHWSLRLVADRVVELEVVEQISHETVRQVLNKNELKPWQKKHWCIPPQANADFVCAMEEVLDVYKRPIDASQPLVCMDEVNTQLLKEVRTPLPVEPGQPARHDYEYEREGVCNVFVAYEPLAGTRFAQVRQHRTKRDWAEFMREILDEHYPTADTVVLVMDNLNTHSPASFYEVFPPAEARRLARKLEIHYTPKHGSWLNMAEIELSVLSRQCLSQRLSSLEEATRQVEAWQAHRNQAQAKVNWRFTTDDARIKLKRLYPSQDV